MSDEKKRKGIPQDVSGKDYGPTYDPFSYGWTTDVGYKVDNKDKYVTSGTFNSDTDELDLTIKGVNEPVKIALSGLSGKDEKVTGGSSTINEEVQSLKLSIGDDSGTTSEVDIDLSGIKDTYYNKTEINEKLSWGEF